MEIETAEAKFLAEKKVFENAQAYFTKIGKPFSARGWLSVNATEIKSSELYLKEFPECKSVKEHLQGLRLFREFLLK